MLQFFQKLQNPDAKFYALDSFYRIRKVQKVCAKENVDALLIINGLDSRENYEYIKLMNWLFLGYNGIECESQEYLDAAFSETIFIIGKEFIRVFADQNAYKKLKNLLIQIPNIELFTITEKEDENKDESEIIKIAQFIKLMKGIKSVAVLHSDPQEKIEKWPLIQSYGLLGMGFFSMQHQIVNLTERINMLYRPHDKHSIKQLIYVVSQRLRGHFSGTLSQLIQLPIRKRLPQKIGDLLELFMDTIEIEENNKYVHRIKENGPLVTLGPYSEKDISIEQARVSKDIPCLHMTIQGLDLFSSVRFARTVFLTKSIPFEHEVITKMSDENYIEGYEYNYQEVPYYQDECFVAEVYKILIISLQEILLMICQDYRKMTIETIQELVVPAVNKVFEQFKVPYTSRTEVQISSFNAFGEEMPINFKDAISFKLTPHFYLIQLEQHNLVSPTDGHSQLGRVTVGDSFILQENCFYIMTRQIPYLSIINTENKYDLDIEQVKKRLVLPQLGQQLSELVSKNRIYIPSKTSLLELPLFESSYYLHEKGLRIFTQELGWMIVLFKDMKKIQIVQGFEHIWIMAQVQNFLLSGLKYSRVALEFTKKGVDQVYMKMLDIFNEQGIGYVYIENPKEFTQTRQGQELLMNKQNKQKLIGNEIIDPQFLLDYLESKQLIILKQVKSDLKIMTYLNIFDNQLVQQDKRIGLILITGVYSSGKNRFAQSLSKFAFDFNKRMQILSFNLLELSILDEDSWINKLYSQLQHNQDDCICVIPSHLQSDIIIEQLLKGKIANITTIKCVINKINVNNLFENQHNNPIPGVISQCLPGYAQVIIIDSFGNNEDDVNEYYKMISNINRNSSVYRTTNNMIQQGVAKEIYENNTYLLPYNHFLRIKHAVLKSTQNIDYNVIFIRSTIPCLKGIRKLLKDTFKQVNNAEKNKQELSEIEQLELKIKEKDQNLKYIKAFIRVEGQLDKLLEFTANQNYVTERTVKINIQMKDVIVNNQKLQIPQYMGWEARENLGFLFMGIGITKEECQQLVKQYTQQMIQLTPQKTQVSDEIIKQLEYENRGIGLENGEFYDGQFIRDQDSNILKHHPKLNIFIEEYLKEINGRIDKDNERIKQEWKNYVKAFDL